MTVSNKMNHQYTRLDNARLLKTEICDYHVYWWSYDEKTVKIAKIQRTRQLIGHNSVNNDRK
jgi:uncharacterized protein YcfL